MFYVLFVVAVLHIISSGSALSENGGIMARLIHLERAGQDREVEEGNRVRTALWNMLCADGACTVSKPPEDLLKITTATVTVFEVESRTLSVKQKETMLFWTPNHEPRHEPFVGGLPGMVVFGSLSGGGGNSRPRTPESIWLKAPIGQPPDVFRAQRLY